MRPFLAPSKRGPIPGSVLSSTYSLPVSSLSEAEREMAKKNATLQAKAVFGKPPPPFTAWKEEEGRIHFPRFFGMKHFGSAEKDIRVGGNPASRLCTFHGDLSSLQEEASASVFSNSFSASEDGGCIVSLPCGKGKTVLAVSIACKLGRKCFVLVHKKVIRDQWKESFERFCPGVKVGFWGEKTDIGECDVVVGMVMTIARLTPEAALPLDAFGLVIADEAHHFAAPVMNRAMLHLKAKWMLGLTATKERPDGLTPLLNWCFGWGSFTAERDDTEKVKVSVALYKGCSEGGKSSSLASLVTSISTDSMRNSFIAERVASYRATGRVVLVLSDRLAQLDCLKKMVIERGVPEEDVGVFKGGQKDSERCFQLSKPVVMCSYGMANEGVDKKEADTCVLATPKGRVTQAIGRVQRPCPTKKHPLVLDVADESPIFTSLRWKRQRLYASNSYEVQVLPTAAKEWWFE